MDQITDMAVTLDAIASFFILSYAKIFSEIFAVATEITIDGILRIQFFNWKILAQDQKNLTIMILLIIRNQPIGRVLGVFIKATIKVLKAIGMNNIGKSFHLLPLNNESPNAIDR